MSELKGRRLLLHEDNQSVVGVLKHLTSKSPAMMCELRELFVLIDMYDIKIRTQYIRSVTNIWADSLSRVTDNSDWQLSPRVFKRLGGLCGSHYMDRLTVSRPSRTSMCPGTSQDDGTDMQKQWCASAFPTTTGGGSTTCATLRGS